VPGVRLTNCPAWNPRPYVTGNKDEIYNIAFESTRTIDIDEFVPKPDIDELYLVRPYYIVPGESFAYGSRGSCSRQRSAIRPFSR
jgi:hypothetical protein